MECRKLWRAFLVFSIVWAMFACAGPHERRAANEFSYRRPFLGRKEIPAELQWLHQVRLAAYTQLPTDPEKEQFVKDMDVDLMDWYCTFSANRGDFMRKRGIRVSGPEEFEYQEALQFSKPDTVAIFSDNGIALKLDGTPATFPPTMYRGSYFMCHNAPKWHEMVKQGLVRLVPFGHTITQDNIGCPLNKGGGNFCRWCNIQFKRYLRQRFSSAQIRRLGISDLDSFDARLYILDKVKSGGNEKAIEDPLVREYIRFQYISEADAWEDMMRAIREESAQQGLPMRAGYGNQYGAWGTLPFATALSSRADVVWIECNAFQPTWGDEKQAWGALVYKIGAASGHFKRPVWTWPIGYCDNQTFLRSKMKLELRKSPSGEPYIGFLKKFPVHLVLCEALAEGGLVVMRPGDHPGTEVYKLHVEYARFVSQNRALFARRERRANLALIYSFPTWMWRRFSSLGVKHDSQQYLPVLARILEEAHIPYEANIFGHPDVWDDSDVLASLSKYDALLLPAVDCLSDRQAQALESYVKNGGVLIVCGDIGTRDEDFNPRRRTALADITKKSGVIQIPPEALRDFLDKDKREQGFEKIKDILVSTLGDRILLKTSAPRTVWINTWTQEDGRRLSVHLLNYDANIEADAMIPARNIRIEVKTPPYEKVVWIPFGGQPQTLPYQTRDGRIIFTVPQVDVYGIAVLTSGNELQIANTLDAARRVRERLNVALEGRGGCPASVTEAITHAEQAMRAADYAAAEASAKQALETGENLLSKAIAQSLNAETQSREQTIASAAKAVLAFDFGNGPTPPGWKQVKSDSLYDGKMGFGWDETRGLRGSDGTYPDALHGDSISADVKRTFMADLPNGDYVVTIIGGHLSAVSPRATTAIVAEGETKLLGVRSYAGIFFNRSFSVRVADGQLNLTFPANASLPLAARADGPKPFEWNVCGLLVRKAGGEAPPDLALNEAVIRGGLRNWAVLGPLDDSTCEGMQIQYAPEFGLDLQSSCEGKNGRAVSWQAYTAGPGVAFVPFRDLFEEEEGVVGFATTQVFAPAAMKARLFFGSTGIGQIWLNDAPILRDHTQAGLMADEFKKDIALRQGWNKILVKVCNPWGGPWAFSAALLDCDNKPMEGLRISPTGDEKRDSALPPAHPLARPVIEAASNVLEFNKANEVAVSVENIGVQPLSGNLNLTADEAVKECVRIEPGDKIGFADLKPGQKFAKRFEVTLLKMPPEGEHIALKATLTTADKSRAGTSRFKVAAPTVTFTPFSPTREPAELAVDAMDDPASWKRNDPLVTESIGADPQDKKEGAASVRVVCLANGNGQEEFARIQRPFPEGTDWTAYTTLRFWAKVTDKDPSVKKRPICVVLNNRDSGGYQALARHEIPVNEWTLIEDSIATARRENVSSLVPHLYETYLDKKTSYTWHLDDLRLVRAPIPAPGADEVWARLYISNPSDAPIRADLSLVLPEGWRCDMPTGTKAEVPARRAWMRPLRIIFPPNAPALSYPVIAKLSFPTGAALEVKVDIQPPRRMNLGLIPQAPTLDGKLDDECWKTARPITNFVLNDGSGLAKAQTRAWICRDLQNLYIAFECLEPATPHIKADVKERDGQTYTDDSVEIFIVPSSKPSGALYHFVFNTLDVLRDEGPGGAGWDSRAKSKTLKGADRWTVEVAIPFADFGALPKAGDVWLVNLNRTRQPKPGFDREYSCWSCTYGPFAAPERFGEVTFER